MWPKSTLDAGSVDFRMRLKNRSRLCDATWKPKSTLVAARSGLWNATEEVDFRLPCETDFRCDYSSRLCATRGGLKMKKTKSAFRKAKAKKLEKTSSFAAGAGLRLRSKSACATGVGWGATVSVDLCHRSGLEYLSHGFQTQDLP
jgi:hypothetical protein